MEETYPDASFPAQKPPFNANEVLVSPGDFIWTTLSAPTGAPRTTVAIITPTGTLHGRLTLPEGRRVVALDRGGVYLVRVDEDGLEWLERYAYPTGSR